MLRMPLNTRGISMALALTAGTALGTVALTGPALAQRQQQQQEQQQTLSREFQPLYQAVADATTAGNVAAGRAAIPAMMAGIKSEYDRFFAGNIMLQLGGKANDKGLQKQGLELMLQSGQGSQADQGLFHYFLGGFAYDAGDYAAALREAQASLATGYQGDFAQQQDPWLLAADAYFKLNQTQEGLNFLKTTIEQRRAANQPVRDQWYARAIAAAYQSNMATEAADLSALMVAANPNQTTWTQALQVVSAMVQSDAQARLDVLRLMALTGALSQRGEYETYVNTLDPRVLAGESGRVLAAGLQNGVFSAGDPFYDDTKRVIDSRASLEAGLAADYASEAASSSNGRAAFNAGDVYLSLGNYAKAEEMFALAVQKGGIDKDQVLTRLGIAQIQQGKNAEAKATFAQVSGQRAAIARMWTLYADTRA